MRRLLSRHRVAIAIAVLYLLSACGFFIARDTIDNLEREVARSTRTDCEIAAAHNQSLVTFAGEVVRILEEAGPTTPAGLKLVAELYASTERLFPVTPCP
jgi:hypothetical protein